MVDWEGMPMRRSGGERKRNYSVSVAPSVWEGLRARIGRGETMAGVVEGLLEGELGRRGCEVGKIERWWEDGRSGGLRLPAPVAAALGRYARRIGVPRNAVVREGVLFFIRERLEGEVEFRELEAWRWMIDPGAVPDRAPEWKGLSPTEGGGRPGAAEPPPR